MTKPFKIACLQTNPMPDLSSALAEALELGKVAIEGDAKLLTLPEYCGGLKTVRGAFHPPSYDEDKHPFLDALKDFSCKNNIFILIGSIAVNGPEGKIYNRSLILDNTGTVISRYDKIHLFDIDLSNKEKYRESDVVVPGNTISICKAKLANFGQTVCYDLRFPSLYRSLSKEGAEILFAPAVFTKKTGKAHWHILNRARAIENGAYVVSPCAVGKIEGGGEGYGHSLIINPWGEVLSDGGSKRGVTFGDINLDEVKSARNRIPSLLHDRSFNLFKEDERVVA